MTLRRYCRVVEMSHDLVSWESVQHLITISTQGQMIWYQAVTEVTVNGANGMSIINDTLTVRCQSEDKLDLSHSQLSIIAIQWQATVHQLHWCLMNEHHESHLSGYTKLSIELMNMSTNQVRSYHSVTVEPLIMSIGCEWHECHHSLTVEHHVRSMRYRMISLSSNRTCQTANWLIVMSHFHWASDEANRELMNMSINIHTFIELHDIQNHINQ